jgi:cytochrome c5
MSDVLVPESSSLAWRRPILAGAAVVLGFALAAGGALAQQRKERGGKEVVDRVCAACHASGTNNAPKIGDAKAWGPRATQGLSALTEHAIKGIRDMPAHGGPAGGSIGVTDIEIERAIIYMVNRSGGNWIEPIGGATPALLRTSDQVVKAQCAKCHQSGENGAPKIGDRAAWVPRLKKGLEPLVASAIHGHGAMPARGGMPDLSDDQIRGAIIAMFSAGIAPAPPVAAATPPGKDPFHRTVGGANVYLGIVSADALRAAKSEGRDIGAMQAGIPEGTGWYHVNISLADVSTKVPITDAEVTAKVALPTAADTRKLELVAANNTVSYGNFFRMESGKAYTVTATIKRAGAKKPIEARFDYKPG